MINVVICVAWGVRLPSRLAESSSVRQTKTSLLPQAVCTFALCALSSKNVDGLNTLGLGESSRETFLTFAKCISLTQLCPSAACGIAGLRFLLCLIGALMSTFQYLVGDLIALCCGIYYGTALMRASKIAKLQAARAPLPL